MAKEKKQPVSQQMPQETPKKKGGFFGRIFTLALLLVVVLVVAVLTTMEDGNQFATLRRWLMYGDSRETKNLYTYASDQNNLFGQMGEDLLVVTPNAIRLLHADGTAVYDQQIALAAPKLSVGREQAVVCDVGGNTLYVLDSTGVIRTMTLERGLCYYTARMNENDYLTVIAQKSGYKSSAEVYDEEGQLLFHFDSHDHYLSDAVVTADNKSLVVAAMQEQGGAFASSLVVYDLASAQQTGACSLRDGLILDFFVSGDRVLSLCDKRLTVTTLAGETLLDRSYDNLYLHDYALTGGDFCALLLGRYQSGNVGELTTYDLDGGKIANMEITEEVLDISAAGDYLAVLYSDSLVLYTRDLTEYSRMDDTDYAAQVRMEEAGTALVISATSAWRFLP